MEIIYVLLPICLVLAGISLAVFIWAVKSGQFDDMKTPAVRILFDDDGHVSDSANQTKNHKPDGVDDHQRFSKE